MMLAHWLLSDRGERAILYIAIVVFLVLLLLGGKHLFEMVLNLWHNL